jgi:hypothetical protein
MRPCDQAKVQSLDYSRLSPDFAKLSKPAKRALINNKIFTTNDLARWAISDVAKPHGIGPSSVPVLTATLRAKGLRFKNAI